MANSDIRQHNGWGGIWTEQKLECFESYVKAYLTIMNSYRTKYHWKLIYFDGFAGCGDRSREKNAEQKTISIFGEENLSEEEMCLYAGAAERVVRLDSMPGFDYYYFVDLYEENLTRLEIKLAPYGIGQRTKLLNCDAKEGIEKLAKFMKQDAKRHLSIDYPNHYKTLCLLDPFGMSIEWDSIVKLAGKSLDLWILVPTGSIVSRLIQNDGKLRYPEKLERFFGLPEQVIRDRFYHKKFEKDLFGGHEEIHKVENSIRVISDLYCEQLGSLFPYVTNEPLVLKNSHNVPLFSFVCASYNQTAVKIAKQIIDKRQR